MVYLLTREINIWKPTKYTNEERRVIFDLNDIFFDFQIFN